VLSSTPLAGGIPPLPDLQVADVLETPFLGFNEQRREINPSGSLHYLVGNIGPGEVQPFQSWTDQIWLGTDANILTPDDPLGGVFHVQIAITPQMGPVPPGKSMPRILQVDSSEPIALLKTVNPHDLKWFVFVGLPPGQPPDGPGELEEIDELNNAFEVT